MRWAEVVGFPEYLVSDRGEVYSKRRNKKLSLHDRRGYSSVMFCVEGTTKRVNVHRLVASAFIPNPFKLPQVNHIDGNKKNNSVENLEWVTVSDNVQHAFDTGLKQVPKKLSDEELELFWEKRKGGMHWKDAMRVFGISKGSVFNYDALGRGG